MTTQLTEPQLTADEFLRSFNAFVFVATNDDAAITAAYERFQKALGQAPFCPSLLLPLAGALHALNHHNVRRHQRIEALEARLAELEREPRGLKYCGVWQRAVPYARHAAVTHQGSVWACVADTSCGEIPGDGSTSWQLAVKAGRDGRDIR